MKGPHFHDFDKLSTDEILACLLDDMFDIAVESRRKWYYDPHYLDLYWSQRPDPLIHTVRWDAERDRAE